MIATLLAIALIKLFMQYPLEELADRVPVVGKYIRKAIDGTIRAIKSVWERAAETYEAKLGAWLNALAVVYRALPDELQAFVTRTKTAFAYLATELVPAKIRAYVNPVIARVSGISARLDTLRGDLLNFEDGIEARVRQLTEQVWTRAIAPVAALESALNSLRIDVDSRLDSTRTWVRQEAVIPLGRVIDIDLPRIRIDVGDVRKLLDGVREWVVPVSLAFSGVAVIELLRHVRNCKPKTEKLCNFDMDAYDDLLGLAFALPSLALIVETMRQSQHLLAEVLPDIRETLT